MNESFFHFVSICSLFSSAAAAKVVAKQTTLHMNVTYSNSSLAPLVLPVHKEKKTPVIKMRKALRTPPRAKGK